MDFFSMDKSYLRSTFLNRRKSLSISEVDKKSRLINSHFFKFLDQLDKIEILHCFLSIKEKNEVSTSGIFDEGWKNGIKTGVPLVVNKSEMVTVLINSSSILKPNKWGVPEPVEVKGLLSPAAIDLIVVPLLVADRFGNRIGYGGGFYDRYLPHLRPDALKVGLSLFEPIEKINKDPWDIALDYLITPSEVYTTTNQYL
jgi:5-formyltetrahydrofolate cyclo-ligase